MNSLLLQQTPELSWEPLCSLRLHPWWVPKAPARSREDIPPALLYADVWYVLLCLPLVTRGPVCIHNDKLIKSHCSCQHNDCACKGKQVSLLRCPASAHFSSFSAMLLFSSGNTAFPCCSSSPWHPSAGGSDRRIPLCLWAPSQCWKTTCFLSLKSLPAWSWGLPSPPPTPP